MSYARTVANKKDLTIKNLRISWGDIGYLANDDLLGGCNHFLFNFDEHVQIRASFAGRLKSPNSIDLGSDTTTYHCDASVNDGQREPS